MHVIIFKFKAVFLLHIYKTKSIPSKYFPFIGLDGCFFISLYHIKVCNKVLAKKLKNFFLGKHPRKKTNKQKTCLFVGLLPL